MAKGIEVWFDEWEIRTGDSLRRKMEEGLANCTHFVVLPHTELPPLHKTWVETEIDAGFIRSVGGEAREPGGSLIVMPNGFNAVNHELIFALAARYGVPTIWSNAISAGSSGLMSYGSDFAEAFRLAAGSSTASSRVINRESCRSSYRRSLSW
jgi:hypothetical protein